MQTKNTKRSVVIGAGYTGLVAALRLAEAGHKVVVMERSDVIGGLASDFKIEGASLERAYHHLFKTDTSIINLSQELGIDDVLKWHDSSVSLYYDGRLYPFKGALDLIKFTPLSLINRIRAGLAVLYLQRTKNWQQFEKITAYSWMLRYAGKQVTKVIWEPLLKGKFDAHFDKVSMAWLWARIHIRAQSREVGGEKLGYFEGGFQTFTNAILDRLAALNVEIIKNISVASIGAAGANKVKVTLQDGSSQIYSKCIVTIPSPAFAKLIAHNKNIPTNYVDQLNGVQYLGARLLIFSSTQDISPYYWHNINDLSLPFLVLINHTKLIDKNHYNGKYIYYVAAYLPHDHELFNMPDEKIEKIWLGGIKKIFPAFDKSKISEKHFFKFANAQHIVETDYPQRIVKSETPITNVFLSNFAQIYPEDRGTNYAVRDGERVASIALQET